MCTIPSYHFLRIMHYLIILYYVLLVGCFSYIFSLVCFKHYQLIDYVAAWHVFWYE